MNIEHDNIVKEFNQQYGHMWLLLKKDQKLILKNKYNGLRQSKLIDNNFDQLVKEFIDYVEKYRAILIVKDKYSTRYFDASTGEKINAVSLKLLNDRNQDNWYIKPHEPISINIVCEDIPALPVCLQEEARKKINSYINNLKLYEQKLIEWENIQKAINENNGFLAWKCLELRSNYEYEKVEFVELE